MYLPRKESIFKQDNQSYSSNRNMSNNSIVHDSLTGKYSLNEHHHQSSRKNPTESIRVIQQAKKGPMNPTPLEYSCWSRHRTSTRVGAVLFFISFTIISGVLIVHFRSPKVKIPICKLQFSRTLTNPLEYNYDPQSVAIADFNSDTWLDFVVSNRAANNISIFLASENNTFTKSEMYSTGPNSRPGTITVGDFNQDEQVDIAVANFGSNTIGIFFGLGNGSFVNDTLISTNSSRPIFIHVVDLNNDTFLDIVTANYGHDSISILHGHGNGIFSHWMNYSTGYDSFPTSLISADLNNDHLLDLAIIHTGTNSIGILFADGNRTFYDQKTLSTGDASNPQSIAVGYLNDDTLLDIVVTNRGRKNVGVFLNSGNGTFDSHMIKMFDSVASPYSLAVGDIDRDHRVDLVVTYRGAKYIGILMGHGDGSFSKPIMHRIESVSSIFVVLRDMNKDNVLDMIVINNDTNSISISFGNEGGFQSGKTYRTADKSGPPILGTSKRDLSKDIIDTRYHGEMAKKIRRSSEPVCPDQGTYSNERGPSSVAFGDINNDTHVDIVIIDGNYGDIRVFFGREDGSFENRTTYQNDSYAESAVVADLNNDNRLDIILLSWRSSYIGILLGYGDGSFGNMTTYLIDAFSGFLAVTDFNNDMQLDIVGQNQWENYVGILLGYGNGSFADQVTYPISINMLSVSIGDFNNDTQLDIVIVGDGIVNVLLGSRNGSFENQTSYFNNFYSIDVAVGDVNNDGRLDIAVVGLFESSSIGVFLGYGNGSFANPITFGLDMSFSSVTFGDFDNDGRMDLIGTETRKNDFKIFHGYGNGSFANYTAYPTRQLLKAVVVGYLNDDNQLDVVVTSYQDASMIVFISIRGGFSTNEMTISSTDGSRLNNVVVNDFNNDTISDIVVVNFGTNNIGVLLRRDDGSFEEQMTFSTGSNSNPYSVTTGNFNKDGKLDLAVANFGTNKVEMLFGDGTGKFVRQMPDAFELRSAPTFVVADDFNHDGQSEVVVAYNNTDNIDILIVYDTGSFTDQIIYSIGRAPSALAVGDFNNDTQLDIVVCSYDDNNIGVFLGYGNGSFSSMTAYPGVSGSLTIAVADFNNDTQLDIVVAGSSYDNRIGILFGYGNGSFSNQTSYLSYFSIHSLNVADFNNDTYLDFLGLHEYESNIGILFGYGNGSFSDETIQPINMIPDSAVVGDFNNDTYPDIVVVAGSSKRMSILLGYGNGLFASHATYNIDHQARCVAVGDLNNDHRLDVAIAFPSYSYYNDYNPDDYVSIYLGYGNGSFFTNGARYLIGCSPNFVAVSDLNQDGNVDIITINGNSKNIGVLLGYGDGTFADQTAFSTGTSIPSIPIGDFNNDSQLDIVVTNSDNGISLLLGDSQIVFKHQITLSTGNGSHPQSFVTGDFNNDTHIDIVVTNSGTNTIGIFLGFGNISFASQITYPTGSSPRSIAATDFNNDTLLDIVVANYDDGTLSVFLGQGNGSFARQTTYSTGNHSQPYSVAVADLNNDSHLDIIVATYASSKVFVFYGYGNGYFSRPDEFLLDYESHPISLAVGDLNGDQKVDFAVINYEKDDLEIWLQTC